MTIGFEHRTFISAPVESVFYHLHLFEDLDAGTLMTDRVRFAAPFGVVGVMAERAVLQRYLRRLIEVRGAYLKAEAERGSGAA